MNDLYPVTRQQTDKAVIIRSLDLYKHNSVPFAKEEFLSASSKIQHSLESQLLNNDISLYFFSMPLRYIMRPSSGNTLVRPCLDSNSTAVLEFC